MRRLLIPIFATMLMAPAFASTLGTLDISVWCTVDPYCAVQAADNEVTLDPNPAPLSPGTVDVNLGIQTNKDAIIGVTGTGMFSTLGSPDPEWDTKLEIHTDLAGDYPSGPIMAWSDNHFGDVSGAYGTHTGTVLAHNDTSTTDGHWWLHVSAEPTTAVPADTLISETVTVTISIP